MDLESELSLKQDLGAAEAHASEAGAELRASESETGVYWLTLHPRDAPDEVYFVRIAWERYPHSPPSVRFADAIDGRLDVTHAWPVIPGYRPSNFDICQPFTREGFAVHAEWVNGPEAWPTSGNPLLWVVSNLVHDMAEHYTGRSG